MNLTVAPAHAYTRQSYFMNFGDSSTLQYAKGTANSIFMEMYHIPVRQCIFIHSMQLWMHQVEPFHKDHLQKYDD